MKLRDIKPGMRVLSSDGTELGAVQDITRSQSGEPAGLLISGHQAPVPLHAVQSVERGAVLLNTDARALLSAGARSGRTDDFVVQASNEAAGIGSGTETTTVPRYEERLVAEKQWTDAGTVRVEKRVVEEPETLNVELAREEYDVERVPVQRDWTPGAEATRTEGDTIIIPLVAEQIEIVRHKVIVEELRLTRRTVKDKHRITETVRREVADVTGPGMEGQQAADMSGS